MGGGAVASGVGGQGRGTTAPLLRSGGPETNGALDCAQKTGPGRGAGAGEERRVRAAERYFLQIAFMESAMLPGVVMIFVKVAMVRSGQWRAIRKRPWRVTAWLPTTRRS